MISAPTSEAYSSIPSNARSCSLVPKLRSSGACSTSRRELAWSTDRSARAWRRQRPRSASIGRGVQIEAETLVHLANTFDARRRNRVARR
jgi:hypothetical protein